MKGLLKNAILGLAAVSYLTQETKAQTCSFDVEPAVPATDDVDTFPIPHEETSSLSTPLGTYLFDKSQTAQYVQASLNGGTPVNINDEPIIGPGSGFPNGHFFDDGTNKYIISTWTASEDGFSPNSVYVKFLDENLAQASGCQTIKVGDSSYSYQYGSSIHEIDGVLYVKYFNASIDDYEKNIGQARIDFDLQTGMPTITPVTSIPSAAPTKSPLETSTDAPSKAPSAPANGNTGAPSISPTQAPTTNGTTPEPEPIESIIIKTTPVIIPIILLLTRKKLAALFCKAAAPVVVAGATAAVTELAAARRESNASIPDLEAQNATNTPAQQQPLRTSASIEGLNPPASAQQQSAPSTQLAGTFLLGEGRSRSSTEEKAEYPADYADNSAGATVQFGGRQHTNSIG